MFHDQYNPAGTDDALHLIQSRLSGRPFQLIQRMGTGDHIETIINEGKDGRISFYQNDRPATGFLPDFEQHPPGKIIARGKAFGILIGKGCNHGACSTTDIKDIRMGLFLQEGHGLLYQKVPRISGIPARMKIYKRIIQMGEQIIVNPP